MRHARHARKSQSRAQMIAANMRKRAPAPEPEPVTTEASPEVRTAEPVDADRYVGYHVESTDNGWHKLIGPDGAQVGAAKRSYDEAFEMIPGSDD